jgi:DNA-binding transcriptional ArsR family regulator
MTMSHRTRFAEIAALAGDPARANMLHALMDGRALTATELAAAAAITPQTASGHLSRMTEAGLLTVLQQGRHRYHRLASPVVAEMMESIMVVATAGEPLSARIAVGPRDAALRYARTCYNHLAGYLGVALADALVAEGHLELTGDAGFFSASGTQFLADLGLDLSRQIHSRALCRPCLDWSERRPHLAGDIGTGLATLCFDKGWTRRCAGSRAVTITPAGHIVFRERFRAKLASMGESR